MQKLNKNELRDYFLSQLNEGRVSLYIGKGKARYKMNRGSFKTSDRIQKMHALSLTNKVDDSLIYSNKDVSLKLNVKVNGDEIKISFDAPKDYNRLFFKLNTFEDECIYGCGEQFSKLNLKGENVHIWVSEHQNTIEILKKLIRMKLFGPNPERITKYKHHQTYYSAPVFISNMNYGIYLDNDSYASFKFEKKYTMFKFRDIPKSISIICKDNVLDVMQEMCMGLGISPRVPSWVGNGAVLAIQGGTDKVREKYLKAKENGVKVSAIWSQDWCGNNVTSFGYQVYWNWKHDDKLYYGLKEFIDELHKDGVKFLGYINTFLKEDCPLYLEAKEKGYLVLREDGSIYHIKSTTFNAGIVDLTNEEAYNWYKELIKTNLIDFGLDGWMADFGEYLPTDAIVKAGEASMLHNIWPTLWAKCSNDAIREKGKEKDIFIFSRAAYSHTPKYTNAMWNGDQHVDYSDDYGLSSVIPATLSSSCSGCGVVHSDIGGYTTVMWMKRDSELLRRWSEMNIFSPIFRTHEGNRPTDNAQFDTDDVIEEFARNSNIFYDLKEYRDSVFDEYYSDGIPMLRPLFAYFDDDKSKLEKKEYLFGKDILVSPVLRAKEEIHKVFLPEGEWVQFFTLNEYKMGEYEVESKMGLPIAFFRKDSKYKNLFESISKKYIDKI